MSTDNRTLRRKLDLELPALEDCYLMLRDLKSDGALGGQPLSVIVPFDDAAPPGRHRQTGPAEQAVG